jgi:hypothetical protein
MSFRIAGGKLVFLDIVQDGHLVQGIANQGHLDAFGSGVTKVQFKNFHQKLQRGDFICMFLRACSLFVMLIDHSAPWHTYSNCAFERGIIYILSGASSGLGAFDISSPKEY